MDAQIGAFNADLSGMSHVSVGEETLVQTKRGKASDPQFPRRSGFAIVHPQFLDCHD